MLPRDFPHYSTVQRYFHGWRDDGTWERINFELLLQAREAAGREASPTAGVIDSPSVKTTESGGPRGGACPRARQSRDPGDAGKSLPRRRPGAANATSSPIPPGCRSAPRSIPPPFFNGAGLCRIVTVRC
jgi:hypothetical protein